MTERLAARLTGPDPGLRAELAVAASVRLGVMYGIARDPTSGRAASTPPRTATGPS